LTAALRPRYWADVIGSVFDQFGPANRQLRRGLAALLVFVMITSLPQYLAWMPGTDLEIPLQAASRWATGGQPYVASSFALLSGTGLPFLYPPWLLPLLVPFTYLPRPLILGAWLILIAGVSIWTCRRLAVPWRMVPLVLLWPPFMEGLVAGNVQLLQLAAFAALFFVPGRSWEPQPRPLRPNDGDADRKSITVGRDLWDGLLAAGVGALKYTQLLPLAWLLRPRPRSAILGAMGLAIVVVVMLPFTGIRVYGDWLDQLGRAADLSWAPAGGPLTFLIGRPLATAAAVVAVGAMFFIRGRDAGAWVGIALVVAAPSLHGYGMLFLLPALLILRRDLALFLAIIIARYSIYNWWFSIAVAAVALAASHWIPALRAKAQPADEIDIDAPDQAATAAVGTFPAS
jgi:hypothetical protein